MIRHVARTRPSPRSPRIVEAPPAVARPYLAWRDARGFEAKVGAHYALVESLRFRKRDWYLVDDAIVSLWGMSLRVAPRSEPYPRKEL